MTRRKKAHHAMQLATAADLGTDGPAMASRPRIRVQVATGERGIGRERAEAVRYLDAHLIDRMHRAAQITDRQYAAALALLRLYVAAGVQPSMSPPYADGPGRQLPPPASQAADADRPTAWDRWHRALRRLSAAHQAVLIALMGGVHPGVRYLATAQAALDALADAMRIARDYAWRDPEWEGRAE